MVNYRKILEHHFNGMTQRTIEVAVGSSRHTIRDVVKKAEEKELKELTEEMTDYWCQGQFKIVGIRQSKNVGFGQFN